MAGATGERRAEQGCTDRQRVRLPRACRKRMRARRPRSQCVRLPKSVVHPRLLAVFELPADESRWMTVTREELVLRRRAYWLSLQQGFAEDAVQQTVTVAIPEQNLFDVEGLRELIERSRKGKI